MRKQMRHMAQSKLCLTTLDRSAHEVMSARILSIHTILVCLIYSREMAIWQIENCKALRIVLLAISNTDTRNRRWTSCNLELSR